MSLQGKRVLVVEDNWLMADEVSSLIRDAGGTVCGPVPTTAKAFELASHERLDGAVLDVRLRDGTSAPLAGALRRSKVPFIVVSGFERAGVPRGMRMAPFVAKPLRGPMFLALADQIFQSGSRRPPPAEPPSLPDLADRLRDEMRALTGTSGGLIMLEILGRRLHVPWHTLYRAAVLAEHHGWLTIKGLSARLTEQGRAGPASPAEEDPSSANA